MTRPVFWHRIGVYNIICPVGKATVRDMGCCREMVETP